MRNEASEEAEANLFARCLLMPESLVREEVQKMGGCDLTRDEDVAKLAKTFQVSVPVMAFRLGELFKP